MQLCVRGVEKAVAALGRDPIPTAESHFDELQLKFIAKEQIERDRNCLHGKQN